MKSVISGLCLFCAMLASSQEAVVVQAFEARVYKGGKSDRMVYRLLKPREYDPAKKYPLVLFLHGADEGGGNNVTQLRYGAGLFTEAANQEKFPCFVVVPQMPVQKPDDPWGWAGGRPWEKPYRTMPEAAFGVRVAMEIVDAVEKEFSVDPNRLYVSGISMGGFGCWDIITRAPGRFAAAIPICGGGEPHKAAVLVGLPIWAFHGDADKTIPVERTREMIAAITKAGGRPKYTEYPGIDHAESWELAFKEPELLPWLFAQKKN